MSLQLKEHQVDRIFTILSNRGVKYIDVQHELVDHIASELEEVSISNPNFVFEEELNKVLLKFPKNFSGIVREKEKSMHRYWRAKTFEFIKSYFRLPKLLIAVGLYFAIYSGTILNGKMVIVSSLLILIPLIIYTLYYYYNNIGVDYKKEKKYLVLRMFMSNTISMIFIPICLTNFVTHNIQYGDQLINWRLAFLTLAIVITCIWCHACISAFPDMLKKELRKKYPYLKVSG